MKFWKRIPNKKFLAFLAIMGPGLVTSTADNDAGGIATYATVGAAYGYQMLWILLLITISLAVVQEMIARMGVVTGKGLSDLIREEFGVKTTAFAMLTLLVANVATTIAEFAGIAAASELLGIPKWIAVLLSALFVWFIVVRGNYKRAEKIFLALSLVFIAYVFAGFLAKPDWGDVARGLVTPTIVPETKFFLLFIATVGTTITPWMQFYLQGSIVDKGLKVEEYAYARADVLFGALVTDFFSFFMIVATGATLYVSGNRVIDSAAQAAAALVPIAGELAGEMFALGLLGASLLAASILPLSTAYAVCEAFGWERGVNQTWEDAPVFYGLYTGMIVIGAAVALIPDVPLITLLLASQTVNGILLPVILVLMLRLANIKRLMGKYANSRLANIIGWGTALIVIAATIVLLVSTALGF
ncbi:MAG: Nramp family divalent metal transporter [Chloroflexi bacterium]|nr:Nramp family divalent metal transporter [Chloroflexota bacterium]